MESARTEGKAALCWLRFGNMMPIHKSTGFCCFLVVNILLLGLMFVHASYRQTAAAPSLQEKRDLVKKLELTDLCLFTDARYTRHLAMADLHSAFQDHPYSLEHFPSGTLMALPPSFGKRP